MAGINPGFTQVSSNAILTGSELFTVDTQLAQGLAPQTELLTTQNIANFVSANSRNGSGFTNLLIGGDFTINPFQRGTSFTGISNGATYTADRFAVVAGSSSLISVSQATISSVAGFTGALQVGRTTGASITSAVTLVQALDTNSSLLCQGQQVTLSFWAVAGSSFSAASSGLALAITTGSGTNQSATNLVAGSWTGSVNNALTVGPSTSFISGSSSVIAITTTMTRYSVTATVPSAATQLGVQIGYTPVGTAGATDFFQVAGVQLELGSTPSAFEHRDPGTELALCQRYYQQINEAANVVFGVGMVSAANAEQVGINLPVTMRSVPTGTLTASGFKFNINGTVTAVGAGFALGSCTQSYITVIGTAASSSGVAVILVGSGTSGIIPLSAEL